jgi:hypothetical protein
VATATKTETQVNHVTVTAVSTKIEPTTLTSVWVETKTVDNVSPTTILE